MINNIIDAGTLAGMNNLQSNTAHNQQNTESFTQTLQDFYNKAREAEQTANQTAQEFAVGKDDRNLHQVMIDLKQAGILVQVMTTTKNEALRAYEELMRMQI